MAYTSLYRRFRPDTFDKVIGQEHIVKTLKNQIINHAVSHAYLFCGTRGTGKTSVAKILARAVNCLEPVGGSPCGKCESCMEMKLSTNFDVMEIDAASNNSVDQIRDLTEKVQFAPARENGYKVYIIDEVHMLSKSAFNALLKTLEEPPLHAIFILCTTEVHQIPQTILSRCLRFDFRLIPTKKLVDHLKSVYNAVGAKYDEDALMLIAQAGAGSVRDTLSIADMCLSYCSENVTYNGVLEVLGQSDPKSILSLTGDILTQNTAAALEKIAKICDSGKNVQILASGIAENIRNLLFIKKCPTANRYIGLPSELFDEADRLQKKIDTAKLLSALDIFTSLEGEFRYTSQARIIFEAAVVKAALTETAEALPSSQKNVSVPKVAPKETAKVEGVIAPKTKAEVKKTDAPKPDPRALKIWSDVIATVANDSEMSLKGEYDSFLKFAVSDGEPFVEGDKLVVYFADGQPFIIVDKPENRALIKKIVLDLSGLEFVAKKKLVLSDDNTKSYLKSLFDNDLKIK